MLSRYISSAIKKARYEILKDNGSFYGEIPGFKGVYSKDLGDGSSCFFPYFPRLTL
jgi:hypothetical protein